MTMCQLLDAFISQDCDAAVRQKLLEALEHRVETSFGRVREFTFNRFNIILDFENEQVIIEDDLDTSDSGACSIRLADFYKAVDGHEPLR